MLYVKNLKSGYKKKLIIDDISIKVQKGEIIALIGHNGAGKSTILKTIFGLNELWAGNIIFNEKQINLNPIKNVKLGMSFLPQSDRVFYEMTVQDNLIVSSYILKKNRLTTERLDDIYNQFPLLYKKRKIVAGKLSGGEQQILSICMSLIQKPKLFLIDEPSLGLSPAMEDKIFKTIGDLRNKYGMSILIVEQKVKKVLQISDRAYVMRLGKVALEGDASYLLSTEDYKKILVT